MGPTSSSSADLSLALQQHAAAAGTVTSVEELSLNPAAAAVDDYCDFFQSEPPESGLLQEIVHGLSKKKSNPQQDHWFMEVDDHQHPQMPVPMPMIKQEEPAAGSAFDFSSNDLYGNINGHENFPMVSEGLLGDIIQYPEFFEIFSAKLRSA